MVTKGIVKQRTKHIDVCYHNSRDLFARSIVEYTYVGTDENMADMFTKPLASTVHGGGRAALPLKGVSVLFVSFFLLFVQASRPLSGYGSTLFLMVSHRMRLLRRPPLGHIYSFLLY